MSRKPKDGRPYIPPVTRIELSEKNIKQRWILIIVLLAVGIGAIGYGISQMLSVQPGWNQVETTASSPNYSNEFTLMYDFSRSGGDAAVANKQLISLYTTAMEDAYRIFSKDAEGVESGNLYTLNRAVNQTVSVDPALYEALEILQTCGNRCIYLAPVYVEYNRVFNAETDGEALLYDPAVNPETAEYIRQVMTFVSDEAMISLELLGNNLVRLNVGEEYLAFAREYGIEEFLDLGWMRNAFVADFVAERMTQQGFVHGYLASFDGFNRTLDSSTDAFDFNIYDRQGNAVFVPGKMTYSGPMSIVFLRDYPLNAMGSWSYHAYEDGRMVTSMIDPVDGICRSSIDSLVCYSQEAGCAQILMEMIPVFMEDQLDTGLLTALTEQGIQSVWCEGSTLCHTEAAVELQLLENADSVLYQKKHIQ